MLLDVELDIAGYGAAGAKFLHFEAQIDDFGAILSEIEYVVTRVGHGSRVWRTFAIISQIHGDFRQNLPPVIPC